MTMPAADPRELTEPTVWAVTDANDHLIEVFRDRTVAEYVRAAWLVERGLDAHDARVQPVRLHPVALDDVAADDLRSMFAVPQIHTDEHGRHTDAAGREYRAVTVDGETTFEVL